MILAVNQSRNRFHHADVVRRRGLSGLGLVPAGYTPAQYIETDIAGFLTDNTIPAGFTVDQLRANLTGEANSACRTWPEQCHPGDVQAAVEAAVARGAARLQQLAQQRADFIASLDCTITQEEGNNYASMCPPGTRAASAPFVVPQGAPGSPAPFVVPQGAPGSPAPAPALTGGGNSTAYATSSVAPISTGPQTIQPSQGVTGGGSASTVASTPAQAVLRNLSRPNMPLQVGDMFSLDVSGAPNSTVRITGSKNGQVTGTIAYGNTDTAGHRSITGSMSPAEVGSWIEMISVGDGAQPYTLSFVVSPVGATPSGAQPSSSGATGGGTATATTAATTVGLPSVVPADASFFSQIPVWAYAAAAVAGFMFFSGGRR